MELVRISCCSFWRLTESYTSAGSSVFYQNYAVDLVKMRYANVTDEYMTFGKVKPQAASKPRLVS